MKIRSLGASDGDPAIVLRLVVVVRGRERRARAHSFADRASDRVGDRQTVEDAEYALIERDVDDLPTSGCRPLAIGDEDAEGDEETAQVIGDGGRPRIGRRAVRKAAEVGQSAEGVRDAAETGQILVGAVLPVARNAAHDQGGIDGTQVLVSEPPALERARAKIFEDDVVTVANEIADYFLPLSFAQVTCHRMFVARFLQPEERNPVAFHSEGAQGVALAGDLDLDDLGPEFGEDRCAERRGDERSEVENP